MLQYIFLIFALLIIGQTQAATNVGGVLLQNTTWTSAGSANPYYLINDVQIPRNVTLVIQPGVILYFSNGDYEILVKGFLKIQGTTAQPVVLQGGSGSNTKYMIKFQSTDLSRSSIKYAQFKGPQKALQLTSAPSGIQQNTNILVVESSTFLANTEVGANGIYSSNSVPSAPSLEFRSCSFNQTTILSANTYSEPIRILQSKISSSTFKPRAGNAGVEINNCTVKSMTVVYDQSIYSSQFQLYNSNATDTTVLLLNQYSGLMSAFIVNKSVIRNFAITPDATNYSSTTSPILTFEDSSMYNVWTNNLNSTVWNPVYLISSIFIHNCQFTLGNLHIDAPFIYYSIVVSILNSVLHQVTFTSEYSTNYGQSPLTMHNVSFINGTIYLPAHQGDISYSTITLYAPPLVIGGNSYISCSSIDRSSSISQANTTGIAAAGLILTNSTIKSFQVGLQIVPLSSNTVVISKSNFLSNSQYNIDDQGVYDVTATGVYWGTNNGGVIANKIKDYWDNINYGEVVYTNYASSSLSAETGCPTYVDQSMTPTTWSPFWGK